jgi:hypothetical protein
LKKDSAIFYGFTIAMEMVAFEMGIVDFDNANGRPLLVW